MVQKWLVPQGVNEDVDNEFSMRYQINISRMISSYDNNSKEVAGLRSFINEIIADENKGIKRINVCGYASPDGGVTANKRLATARAVDCRNFINKSFNMSKYPGNTEGFAQPWSATKEAITKSAITNKTAVLSLVSSSQPSATIEQKLKEMPASWRYISANILPPMRCVEVEVVYTGQNIVTTRKFIEPEVIEQNNIFIIFTERPSYIYTFTNPTAASVDFKGCRERCPRGKRGYGDEYGRGDKRGRMSYKIKNRRHSEKVKSDSRGFLKRRRERIVYR